MTIIEENRELEKKRVIKERIFNENIYPYLNYSTIDGGTNFDLIDPSSAENNNFNCTENK